VRGLCLSGAIRWHNVVRQGRYLGFCVCDVYCCSQQRVGGCCCIVQLGSTILCMLEFCSSLFIGYGTIHMLFIIICLLLSVCKQASVCPACVREHLCSRRAWPSVSIGYCTIHLSLIIITIHMLLIINLYCCLCVVCYYALSCWTFQLHFPSILCNDTA